MSCKATISKLFFQIKYIENFLLHYFYIIRAHTITHFQSTDTKSIAYHTCSRCGGHISRRQFTVMPRTDFGKSYLATQKFFITLEACQRRSKRLISVITLTCLRRVTSCCYGCYARFVVINVAYHLPFLLTISHLSYRQLFAVGLMVAIGLASDNQFR